jgi:hypothetical protein
MLAMGASVVGGCGADRRREDFFAHRMDAHVRAFDKRLKLHGTPADRVEPRQIVRFEEWTVSGSGG